MPKLLDSYVFIGRGSGILLGPDGYILTNDHVIEDYDVLEAHLVTGQAVQAKVIGRDRLGDVALLKIEGDLPQGDNHPSLKNFSAVPFGRSSDCLPGTPVLALGNPFVLGTHDFLPTLTHGIISADHFFSTRYRLGKKRYRVHFQALQIDAPINPGNSGGPLFTPYGKLIGLTSSLRSRWNLLLHEPSFFNTGAGYAIPISYIQKILPLLKKGVSIRHGTIPSIRFQPLSFYLTDQGLPIQSLKKGDRAYRAGLRSGDRILTVQGFPVLNERRFWSLCEMFLAGETVELTLERRGKILRMPVLLEPYRETVLPPWKEKVF